MSKRIQIVGNAGAEFNAGPKAVRDIAEILRCEGWFVDFVAERTALKGVFGRYLNRFFWFIKCRILRRRIPKNSTVFMTYPNAGWSSVPMLSLIGPSLKKRKALKLITLITDIKSFHWAENVAKQSAKNLLNKRLNHDENRLCSLFDKIIVHNESMKALLIECGVPTGKIYCLRIFDYLTDCKMVYPTESSFKKIVYAGNLTKSKSPFVSELNRVENCKFELFGHGYESGFQQNVEYRGVYSPDDLANHITGGFGLVWDGGSVESCVGPIAEYYRIISPHKLSFYLSSGLPVFIWSGCGQVDFVVDNGIGYAIDSIMDIAAILNHISYDEYKVMRQKVMVIANKLRAGAFTRTAVTSALA